MFYNYNCRSSTTLTLNNHVTHDRVTCHTRIECKHNYDIQLFDELLVIITKEDIVLKPLLVRPSEGKFCLWLQ